MEQQSHCEEHWGREPDARPQDIHQGHRQQECNRNRVGQGDVGCFRQTERWNSLERQAIRTTDRHNRDDYVRSPVRGW